MKARTADAVFEAKLSVFQKMLCICCSPYLLPIQSHEVSRIAQDLLGQGALDSKVRNDDGVLGVGGILLEDLAGQAILQHGRGCQNDPRPTAFQIILLLGLHDVLEHEWVGGLPAQPASISAFPSAQFLPSISKHCCWKMEGTNDTQEPHKARLLENGGHQ